jgi:hypothetical protein
VHRFLRLGLIVVAIALLGSARGQTFSAHWGTQIASGTNTAFVPQFGIHLGAEIEWGPWFVGARASGSALFILILHGALDTYAGYTLESGWRLYGGAGIGSWTFLFFGQDGGSASASDIHGLLGVRTPYGLFFEALPGLTFSERCSGGTDPFGPCPNTQRINTFLVVLKIGWSLRF